MNPIDSYNGQRVRVCEPGQPAIMGTVVWNERSDPAKHTTKKIRIRFRDDEIHPRTRIWAAYVHPIPTPEEILDATCEAFAKAYVAPS